MRFGLIFSIILIAASVIFFHITNMESVEMVDILSIPLWKMILKSLFFLLFLMFSLKVRDFIIHKKFNIEEIKKDRNLTIYYSSTFSAISIALGFIIGLV